MLLRMIEQVLDDGVSETVWGSIVKFTSEKELENLFPDWWLID